MTPSRTTVAQPTQSHGGTVTPNRYDPAPMHTIVLAGAEHFGMLPFSSVLQDAGHEVVLARTRGEVVDLLQRGAGQALIICGRLADGSFSDAIRAVRQARDLLLTPCLVVGDSDDRIDRIVALELGADDFVSRDTSDRELLLRVRSLLRRAHPPRPEADAREKFGRIELDRAEHRVWVDDREIGLSATDFRLLVALATPAGAVHRREPLEALLSGDKPGAGARWLDARVSRLRARLLAAGAQVETVRGVGFRLGVQPG